MSTQPDENVQRAESKVLGVGLTIFIISIVFHLAAVIIGFIGAERGLRLGCKGLSIATFVVAGLSLLMGWIPLIGWPVIIASFVMGLILILRKKPC